MRITFALPALLAGAAAASTAASPPSAPDLPAAYSRGAACLEARTGRPDLGDPYLAFVYPEEALPSGAGMESMTYRRADARIMLAQLARTVGQNETLAAAGRAAEASLAAAAPAWKRAGLLDLSKGPGSGGIALDTFCIVGWLLGDREMAGTVAAAVSADTWLPEGLYEGEEAFRRSADECWCLRMLAEASPPIPVPAPVVRRIAATLGRSAGAAPGGRGTFYEALHLGMALEKGEPAFAPAAREAAAAIAAW